MRITTLIFSIFVFTQAFAQSKDEMIENAPMDTVIQYPGEGVLFKGNCLFVKFSKDPQLLMNEIAKLHTQDEDLVERTKNQLIIYNTTKPYWVYGQYSVYVDLYETADYALIEIYYKAYSNPENYRIMGAAPTYQKIVNSLLGK